MQVFKRVAASALVAATLAALTACGTQPMNINGDPNAGGYPTPGYSNSQYPATQYPANTYPAGTVQQSYAEYGRVTNIQVLQSQEQGTSTGAGAIIGGIAGVIVGNQIGGGSGRNVARVAGLAGGALAGNAIEKSNSNRTVDTYRVSVQLDNGTLRAYDLPALNDLRAGDRVRIQNGQLFRF